MKAEEEHIFVEVKNEALVYQPLESVHEILDIESPVVKTEVKEEPFQYHDKTKEQQSQN